ncbi:MAG: hypothetical protein JNM94_06895 [Phycisphaerae bacterium]|nr:hypothetical protein [Phycisphaerae bacterium]
MHTPSRVVVAVTLAAASSIATPSFGQGAASPPVTPAVAAPTTAAPAPTADALLARHLEACGGAETLAAAAPLTTNATVRFQGTPITGTYVARRAAPNRFKVVIDLGDLGTVSQGFDGTTAWSLDQDGGPRVLTGIERTQLEREAALDREAKLFDGFPKRETRGTAKRSDVDCWEVRASGDDGSSLVAFFEVSTGLLRGVDRTVIVAGSPVKTTTTIRAYASYDAPKGRVQLPRQVEISADDRAMTIETSDVSFAALDDALFEPPASVRAIQKEAAPAKRPESGKSPEPEKKPEPAKKPD